jgi:hypothetical protein
MEEVHDLRGTMFMLFRACESESLAVTTAAAQEASAKHRSSFRTHSDR